MTTTALDICSQASLSIGAQAIESFDEPFPNIESQISAARYNTVRDQELSSYDWNFTNRDWLLTQLVSTPTDPLWTAEFAPPPFPVLEIIKVVNEQGQPQPFRYQENKILMQDPAGQPRILKYRARVPETEWPPYFVEMMVARMSLEIAETVSGENTLFVRLEKLYTAKRKIAKLADARSNYTKPFLNEWNSPWIGVRW
jgi:hypothetical protein